MPAGGSCLLGSLNLSEFVINPFTKDARIDYHSLRDATKQAVIALNEVLIEGLPLHPLQVQRDSVSNWRQIGLGTMGLYDCLVKLGIKYGSKGSIEYIESIFKNIAATAISTSLELAKEKGCYPMCNKEALVESSFIKAMRLSKSMLDEIREYGLYNSQLLTCAPTGSIATMLQVSSGVEPAYALSFNRRTVSLNKEETVYKVDIDIVKQYKEVTGNTELPDYFVTSYTINPYDRLKVQAALQTYIDASISSTLNLPESTTVDEVFKIYYTAWELGLKGITIWRDNCDRQGILTTTKKEEPKEEPKVEEKSKLKRGEIIKAGQECIGLKRTLTTGCGSLHCEAFFDPFSGELREIYLSKGSTGGCNNYMVSLSRMISLAARGGVTIDSILDQLKSCGVCPSYAVRAATKKDTSKGSCCPVAVGVALKDMYDEMQEIVCRCNNSKVEKKTVEEPNNLLECPNCHTKSMIKTNGCVQCPNCGHSKCD